MAFMYWSRPRTNPSHVQAIHLNGSIISFYYMDSTNTFTIPICWLGIKLARTAPIAVAAIKVVDAHFPLYFFTLIFRDLLYFSIVDKRSTFSKITMRNDNNKSTE